MKGKSSTQVDGLDGMGTAHLNASAIMSKQTLKNEAHDNGTIEKKKEINPFEPQ